MQVQAVVTPQVTLNGNRPADLGKDEKSSSVLPESAPVASAGKQPDTQQVPLADKVSLSAEATADERSELPAPIYAEIWKEGVKIAQVDVHGRVMSFSGMVSSAEGGGLAGALLAAQRAVQVARQVGGEIRAAGQSLDSQTLLMRARLARTYSV